MLLIREHQLEQLTRVRHVSFVERLVDHVLCHYPKTCAEVGSEALATRVETAVSIASRHGFTSEYDVARLALFLLATDMDVGEVPAWARTILEDFEASPSRRLNRLRDGLVDISMRGSRHV